MYSRAARVLTGAATGLVIAAAAVGAEAPTRGDAEVMERKLAAITAVGGPAARRTTITEQELNAYLLYDAGPQLPVGVVEPSVSILGTGRLSGRAVVDLDAVRKSQPPTGFFDPRALLGGHLPVTATGLLTTNKGVGRFQLESATVGGIPVPKVLLQEIVSYYSKSTDNTAGIRLDDAFPLPSGIQEIQIQRGQAIIVQ